MDDPKTSVRFIDTGIGSNQRDHDPKDKSSTRNGTSTGKGIRYIFGTCFPNEGIRARFLGGST